MISVGTLTLLVVGGTLPSDQGLHFSRFINPTPVSWSFQLHQSLARQYVWVQQIIHLVKGRCINLQYTDNTWFLICRCTNISFYKTQPFIL